MLIFNTPIKATDTFKIAADWINNLLISPTKENKSALFQFVYFSYQPDFEFLKLSVQSLVAHIPDGLIKQVNLFVDQKAPFSETEIAQLQAICPKLKTHKVYEFAWASTETTMSELTSFLQIADESADNDFIVKVDSDILFFKNKKLPRLLTSKYAAVGDGHHLQYKHAQGGLYMIRSGLIKQVFTGVSKESIQHMEQQCGTKGEDKVVSSFLSTNKPPFYLTRLMLFPDEYQIMNKLNKLVRWEFCAKHFVKDKDNMINEIDS